jgi:hypothetical protein
VIDPVWGGIDALAHFTDKAHQLGMKVQCWWASHLSPRAPIYKERPDFRCICPEGRARRGGFAFNTLVTMDLNNEDCWEWNYQHIKAIFDQANIDGLWHDSYGNMTFLPVNHADPLRRGQQEPFTRLLNAWQSLGMDTWGVEGMGPYGFGHFGMGLRASERENWQHSLAWWTDHADMIKGLNLGIHSPVWDDQVAARAFAFRALAFGGRFDFAHSNDGILEWTGWLREQNRIHAQLLEFDLFNGKREVLPDDTGVLWRAPNGAHACLFAFKPFTFDLPAGVNASRLTDCTSEPANITAQRLQTQPMQVYRIG